MRQLSCMSADVYCQPQMFIVRNLIIIFTQQLNIYTQTERRGKGLAARETQRESVRETESG